MAVFTRNVPAPAIGERRTGELRGHVAVGAVRAGGEPVLGVEDADADIELVGEVVGRLGVEFEEAHVLLGVVAVRQGRVTGRIACEQRRAAEEALATRIVVVQNAEIERELVEGRAHAAIEIDFRRGAVREVDAVAGDAGVPLQVRRGVIAAFEIGVDRRLVVRLRNAAEIVIGRDAGADRDVERRRNGHRRGRLGDHLAEIGSERGRARSGKDHDRRNEKLLHNSPLLLGFRRLKLSDGSSVGSQDANPVPSELAENVTEAIRAARRKQRQLLPLWANPTALGRSMLQSFNVLRQSHNRGGRNRGFPDSPAKTAI